MKGFFRINCGGGGENLLKEEKVIGLKELMNCVIEMWGGIKF